ncbi:MAG: hypothetical protein SNJ68_09050, partial [Cyanobacteriota bacterium]
MSRNRSLGSLGLAVSQASIAHKTTREDWLQRGLILLVALGLLVSVVLPLGQILSRSLVNTNG